MKYIDREQALSFPFANERYDHDNANEHFINGCETYKEWLEQLPTIEVDEPIKVEEEPLEVKVEYEPVIAYPFGWNNGRDRYF